MGQENGKELSGDWETTHINGIDLGNGCSVECKNGMTRFVYKMDTGDGTETFDMNTLAGLRKFLEDRSKDEVGLQFLKQYSVFQYDKRQNQWYMGCEFSFPIQQGSKHEEGIYDPRNLEFNDFETDVEIQSWKGNYESYQLDSMVNHKGKSKGIYIYACDLYEDFTPRHFKGSIWTRGGFNGWNWFSVTDKTDINKVK